MQSINFDTGYKTYAVNGDERNVVRINVADLSIKSRLNDVYREIAELEKNYRDIENPTSEQFREIDKVIKEKLNYAFGTDICTPAFGSLNCLSVLAKSGKSVMQAFMEALMPIIQKDVDEYTADIKQLDESKMKKYLKPVAVPNKGIEKIDIGKLSQEEKDKILSEMIG